MVYERDFTVLSLVGTLVSFQDHYFASLKHEAHPAGETRFRTMDLARQADGYGEFVKLTDLFSESDILTALLTAPLIEKALRNAGNRSGGDTLAELIEEFSAAPIVEDECYAPSDDLLTRFAFHRVEHGKVAVRLGLSGAGPCRESITEVEILLPIPERLERPLALAESRAEGFPMKDQQRIARGKKTTFGFAAGEDTDR